MTEQINTKEIALIAACLSDNYLSRIYDLSQYGYIDALSFISDWAHEYYNAYYELQKDWDAFEPSADNIYNAVCWDDFLIAWGADRFSKQFM